MKLTIKELSNVIVAARELKRLLGDNKTITTIGSGNHTMSPAILIDGMKALSGNSNGLYQLSKAISQLNNVADKLEEATVSIS